MCDVFVIIIGFVCGAMFAQLLFEHFNVMAMFFPATCCFALALGYWVFRKTQKVV